ncbi:MAG: hypothetical protein UIH99_01445, partial [Alphaproteobacteria bacterium]|nr:hypothetical protein [Alphaproteobacteria bacterium]
TPEQTKLLLDAGASVYEPHGTEKRKISCARKEQNELIEQAIKQRHEKIAKKREYLKSNPYKGQKSGVVFADAIAKLKQNGIIKGPITPEVAKNIIEKMTRDY